MTSSPLEPIATRDWNRAKARHLLQRAGFGVPTAEIERMQHRAPADVVREFVHYEGCVDNIVEPDWIDSPHRRRQAREEVIRAMDLNMEGRKPSEEERDAIRAQTQKRNQEIQREEREDIERLKAWWLRAMLQTTRPLQEKLTLFWHGHFATSAQKVQSGFANHHLNSVFRANAAGNFKTLTGLVGRSPAMLQYLDNRQNTRRSPNENWARELMELFTLGEGHYTEDDIKNSARAFTGWSTDGAEFIYNFDQHDDGEKVFMGRRGSLSGADVIDVIFEQPQCARFIAAKLWTFFAYADPEDEIVEGLAATLRSSGYEIKPVLDQMFLSRAFYDEKAIATQVKSPAQLVVGMCSHLGVVPEGPIERYLLVSMRQMGQDLFYPPNVKGWDGGRTWINTNTLMTRYNLSNFLAQGVASDLGPGLRRVLGDQRQMIARQRKDAANQAAGETNTPAGIMADNEVGMVGAYEGPKGFKLPLAAFDATMFFKKADGLPIAQVADFLSDFLYGAPLREDQREEVLEALGGDRPSTARLDVANWDIDRLRSALHLMLSTAEYQLC